MKSIEEIKAEILRLYESGESIHIDINSKKPKLKVENSPVIITGVYKNFFRIEIPDKTVNGAYTVQYTDVFIGKIEIREMKKVVV